jgi:hypothetical protein
MSTVGSTAPLTSEVPISSYKRIGGQVSCPTPVLDNRLVLAAKPPQSIRDHAQGLLVPISSFITLADPTSLVFRLLRLRN